MDPAEQVASALQAIKIEIAGASQSTDTRLTLLTEELKELRDTRFRPYLTSMGLFLALVLGVTGYVYRVEMGFNQAVFALQDRIQGIELRGELNRKQYILLEERVSRMQDRTVALLNVIVGKLDEDDEDDEH